MEHETMKVITRDTLAQAFQARKLSGGVYAESPVVMAETKLGKIIKNPQGIDPIALFKLAFSAKTYGEGVPIPKITGKYGTILAAPFAWVDGKTESVLDRVKRGAFASTSNTLLPDWQQLWEVMKFDLTARKEAKPTVRQILFNTLDRPDADKTNKAIAYLPWDITFEIVNANGQPIPQGSKYGAITDTFDIEVYSAGFTWTLLAALFDRSLDMTQMNDAVAVGYNSKRDALAFDLLMAYSYGDAGTAKHTAADTTGADKFEKLYLTLENAIEGLSVRKHPLLTENYIQANDLIFLGSSNSCRHVSKVAMGFPSVTNNRRYPPLAEISTLVAYDGEGAKGYSGIGDTFGYLVKRNEFMNIITKRGLTAEIDMQPDVKTLAQEERAWWFAEGIYTGGDYGLGSFIQKITLPSWS